MNAEQIRDSMREVEKAWQSLEEGSTEWNLLHVAHSELGSAHSLVHEVKRLQLWQLLNGTHNA